MEVRTELEETEAVGIIVLEAPTKVSDVLRTVELATSVKLVKLEAKVFSALEIDAISELISDLTEEIELFNADLLVGTMLLDESEDEIGEVIVMMALDMEASTEDNASEAELTRADTLELISVCLIKAELET